MELTPIQKEILMALITIARKKNQAVKGEEIASMLDRSPGTIRNQMQSLKMLQLVDGIPGPKGGYIATSIAYEVLNIQELEKEAMVPICRNSKMVEDATVLDISFTAIRHPDICNGIAHIIGDTKLFDCGDQIQIGPTPVNKLIIRGEIIGRDDTKNSLIFSINEMVSLPKKPIKDHITGEPVTVNANATIQECARTLLINNVHGALVKENKDIIGIVTFTDIGRTLAEGDVDSKIKDIMTKDIISVDGNTPLYEVVKIFDKYKVGRLMVTEYGKPIGVISKTDVLHELAVY
ncbi:MAG TPA: CBS domain-containing protein [Methanosarcinales archaeon]|nr:CBS domain-containing protein [Methanosarcinales archaeon]